MFNTIDELMKATREQILCGNEPVYDEVLVRCFFDELQTRQKRGVKKRSVNHFQDWLYYIAYDGRLARVPNTAKNPSGSKLVKTKKIKLDSWGLLRADSPIEKGQFVKVRPLLEEIDKGNHWSETCKEKIAEFLDGGLDCTMTIDRDFERAYEPRYREDFCLEGDLVTGTSCMSGRGSAAQEFYGNIDGCYVCRFENDDGEQVGRCIMYEYNGVRHFIRIYAKKDYARCALRLLKREMKEGDLFGREEAIPDMHLKANWSPSDRVMYLDGESYGVALNTMEVVNTNDFSYDLDFSSTDSEELCEYLDYHGYERCEHCQEYFRKSDGAYIDDHWYCCEDCAESDGCVRCEYCDEYHKNDEDGYYAPSGEWYCCERCLSRNGWYICEECGEIVSEDEIENIGCRNYCSEECARNAGWSRCSSCKEWFLGMHKNINNGELLCDCCADEKGLKLGWVSEKQYNKKEVKND